MLFQQKPTKPGGIPIPAISHKKLAVYPFQQYVTKNWLCTCSSKNHKNWLCPRSSKNPQKLAVAIPAKTTKTWLCPCSSENHQNWLCTCPSKNRKSEPSQE
jgi:hypothetical protein